VYTLGKNHEFVFVLSRGSHLDRDNPRTSYIGHVDPDNTITLTDLKDVTERNTSSKLFPELFVQDIADPHVHVTNYDPNYVCPPFLPVFRSIHPPPPVTGRRFVSRHLRLCRERRLGATASSGDGAGALPSRGFIRGRYDSPSITRS